jgi:hypothetical protein
MTIQFHLPGSRIFLILLLAIVSMSVAPVSAVIFSEDGSNVTVSDLYNLTNSTDTIAGNISPVFFYDPDCGACGPVHEYIEGYMADHPEMIFKMVNLSEGQEAENLLDAYYSTYNREWVNIPVVFIGPMGLEGTQEIINNFDGLNSWYSAHNVTSIS